MHISIQNCLVKASDWALCELVIVLCRVIEISAVKVAERRDENWKMDDLREVKVGREGEEKNCRELSRDEGLRILPMIRQKHSNRHCP